MNRSTALTLAICCNIVGLAISALLVGIGHDMWWIGVGWNAALLTMNLAEAAA